MAKPNWKDKTIWTANNLPVMRGMNSESVDLIYLDPPFNSKRNYAAPTGSKAAGAEFKDTWTLSDVDVEWINLIGQKHPALHRVLLAAMTNSDKSYLAYMAVRILEMRRILKPTGSIYLHCDPTMSHYLKLVMDAVFGKAAFRNEIVWRKYAGRKNNAKTKFSTQHDTIFFYAKSAMTKFNGVMLPHTEKEIAAKYNHVDADGRRYRYAWGRQYRITGKNRKLYLDESPGRAVGNLWVEEGLQINTSSSERTGYPTQKPLALLERIIKASSDPSGKGGGGGGGGGGARGGGGGGGGSCIRPLLWLRDDAGGGRPLTATMGWRGCIEESGRAGGQAHQKGTGAIPVYHSSHGHTEEDGLGTPATVQSSQKQNQVVRRTGRGLRRLRHSLRKTSIACRSYYCADRGGNRSHQQSATAMPPLQQRQRRPWHGLPDNSTSTVINCV